MTHFNEATSVRPRPGGTEFDVDLDARWSVGTKLHGGYLLAVLGRAAASARHPHPHTVSASFLEPPDPGPAVVETETLRVGRGTTQSRARLVQGGQIRVEALIAQSLLEDTEEPVWSAADQIALPPEDACFPLPVQAPGAGFSVPLMGVIDQRIDPGVLGFVTGAPSRRGVVASWQRLADGTDWDPLSTLVALDMVPPVSYELGLAGWTPTIQLTAYLRRLPAPGPLRVRVHATEVGASRMDQTAFAWDTKDRLVAQSTQLTALRT
jgi:acyl-coenzyme A thioesterase PaaI-like protein